MPDPYSEKRASPREGRGAPAPQAFRRGEHMSRVGSIPVVFFPGMAGHPCLTLRATSLSLQGDPANTGKG
jgi:hypothetical protein